MRDFIPTCVPEVKFRGQGRMCHCGQVCVSQDEKSLMEVFWFFFYYFGWGFALLWVIKASSSTEEEPQCRRLTLTI